MALMTVRQALKEAMAEEMPMPADEDFLKSIAQEGSMR